MSNASHGLRLVLHPGHAKCGSSTIQSALRSNADALLKQGFLYPPGRPNRVLRESCLSGNFRRIDSWLSRLLDDMRRHDCHTLIISSENLGVRQMVTSGRPAHEALATSFESVDVVYYLRRQDEWMISMWQQWGHKNGTALSHFIDERLGFHEPGYRAATELFEDVYGADHVEVTPLHPEALTDGDLIADFALRAGIDALRVDDSIARNPSMSGYLCDVLARVPAVYDQALVAGMASGMTDHSVRRTLEGYVSADLLFNRDKRVMSLEQRRRVMDYFEFDNQVLQRRYFDSVPFDRIFGVDEHTPNESFRELEARIDGLTDVVAMQIEVILKLLKEREAPAGWRTVPRLLKQLRRRLRRTGRSV